MDRAVFAMRLVQAIANKNMTPHQFAKKLGVSASKIYSYIRQDALPSLPSFFKMCVVLGESMDYITGRTNVSKAAAMK